VFYKISLQCLDVGQVRTDYRTPSISETAQVDGDCLTYALVQSIGLPLLFNGKDFAETDVMVA
jgi:hypothetical protein